MNYINPAALLTLSILATPLVAQDWDPMTNAKIGIVQAEGKIIDVESMACQPISAVKWFTSMTYNFKIKGAKADAAVTAPTSIRLVGINPKKIRNLNLVKLKSDGPTRIWKMKASMSDFSPFSDYEVVPVKERPEPVKGDDGVYTLAMPKAMPPGEYGLQISAEIWDFTVK